jgi:ribosomal-protein-alanine N-acetyltransferase
VSHDRAPIDPESADRLANLHLRCFGSHPRPWTAAEIEDLLSSPLNFLLSGPQGFLIGRAIADEAELLTLAVAPEARRQGIARELMAQFYARSRERGADRAFLEVAAGNAAAQALYQAEGWTQTGLRRNYYAPGVDAILMSRAL